MTQMKAAAVSYRVQEPRSVNTPSIAVHRGAVRPRTEAVARSSAWRGAHKHGANTIRGLPSYTRECNSPDAANTKIGYHVIGLAPGWQRTLR